VRLAQTTHAHLLVQCAGATAVQMGVLVLLAAMVGGIGLPAFIIHPVSIWSYIAARRAACSPGGNGAPHPALERTIVTRNASTLVRRSACLAGSRMWTSASRASAAAFGPQCFGAQLAAEVPQWDCNTGLRCAMVVGRRLLPGCALLSSCGPEHQGIHIDHCGLHRGGRSGSCTPAQLH
jgi:hypothetical protein